MANFEVNGSIQTMIKNIESLANSEEQYQKMISAGQEIMKSAIESGAKKHVVTGQMANSLGCTKPRKTKDGFWIGRVRFQGSSGKYKKKMTHEVYTSKKKDKKKLSEYTKTFDITNWVKAYRIEYGSSKQKAEPFVRPAIQSCQGNIKKKWDEIMDKELKKLQ